MLWSFSLLKTLNSPKRTSVSQEEQRQLVSENRFPAFAVSSPEGIVHTLAQISKLPCNTNQPGGSKSCRVCAAQAACWYCVRCSVAYFHQPPPADQLTNEEETAFRFMLCVEWKPVVIVMPSIILCNNEAFFLILLYTCCILYIKCHSIITTS